MFSGMVQGEACVRKQKRNKKKKKRSVNESQFASRERKEQSGRRKQYQKLNAHRQRELKTERKK